MFESVDGRLPEGSGRQPVGEKKIMPTESPYHFIHI